MPVKILAFAGSLRKDSFNKKLIKIAMKGAEQEGAEVTYIDLKDYPLPVYDEDIETGEGIPENAGHIKRLMIQSDGFLISCPEYNSSMTAAFKNTIDWVSRPSAKDEIYLCAFIDKVVSLLSTSPGELGGLRCLVHVRAMFNNINSIVLPKQKSIPKADQAFNDEGKLKDPKLQKAVEDQARELVKFIKKIKGQ